MLRLLRRHPFGVAARFRHSLALTYAFPADALAPLLPPGLVVDERGELGFAAVALVQTERLRPSFLPPRLGVDFFLAGYRIFVRVRDRESLRGLYIVRSDTNRALMVLAGNVFTHYGYRRVAADVAETPDRLDIRVRSRGGETDLDVSADLAPAPLPATSPFATVEEARAFAGPLPFTFAHERATGSLVAVRATRSGWMPETVAVEARVAFFEREPFVGGRLANAFHVGGIEYRWERGRVLDETG